MYKAKICPICNESFQPTNAKMKYCKRPVSKMCIVCGDSFETECSQDAVNVCSKSECKKRSAYANSKLKTHTCSICGDTFYPNSSRQKYCNKVVIRQCSWCGKDYQSNCKAEYDKCCSKECLVKYAHQQSVNAQMQATRICKLCGKEFHPVNNTQLICKDIHYRNCKICGNQFVLDTKQMSKEWAVTCSRKCHIKLAHDNVSEEARAHSVELARLRKFEGNEDKLAAYQAFMNDPANYLKTTFTNAPTIQQLADSIGLHSTTAGQLIKRYAISDLISFKTSNTEAEIIELISNISNTEIIHNTRNIITPLELDIYLPEYQIGIECNPTATHNSSKGHIDSEPKPIKYHQHKTDMCEENGIFLFHIFGYEWTHKRAIIESMIRNLLRCNTKKIYARQCEIREVSNEDAKVFLDTNHRQGNVNGSIRYGLYYEDELVSLMTFSKTRNTIGTGTEDLSDCFELLRFCNKLNTSVVGGASKLFKHFIKIHNPARIRSFSDRAHTKGNLYKQLNFTEIRRSDPGYVWVDLNTDKAYSRINAQKQNIQKFLKDIEIDLSQSESHMMEEHGYVKVYDSGTVTWEWTNN